MLVVRLDCANAQDAIMLIRLKRTGLNVRGRVISIDAEATGMLPWGGPRRVVYDFGTKKKPDVEARMIAPARAFVWTLCDQDGHTDYLRGQVDPITRQVTWDAKVLAPVAELWNDPQVVKVGHNLRYDVVMAEHGGMRVRGRVVDTQILAHIATAGNELTYALKPLAKKRFGYPDDDESELMKEVNRQRLISKKKRWSFATKAFA